jgi:voltage-gated potassium channel
MVPVVATASSDASVDILSLAGASQVLRMGQMLGAALARRVLGRDGRSRVIGQFDDLRIAEAAVGPTGLVGRTLAETRLRQEVGVTVVGTWYRGGFKPATPETLLHRSSLLVLAGSAEQLAGYDQRYAVPGMAGGLTLIIGSGRVGRAVAAALVADGQDFTIIDKDPDRIHDADRGLVGDAARREVLEQAGIDRCSAVVITPRDDDMNVYLTLYCRKLRPDIQILSRATLDRNVSTLHRAGADFVMSYATTGATTIYNLLRRIDILLLAEGLHIFRVDMPPELAGQRLGDSRIRQQTGCTVVAVGQADHFSCNPGHDAVLASASELVLIGDADAESRFLERFPRAAARPSDNSVLVADQSQVVEDRYAETNEELS